MQPFAMDASANQTSRLQNHARQDSDDLIGFYAAGLFKPYLFRLLTKMLKIGENRYRAHLAKTTIRRTIFNKN